MTGEEQTTARRTRGYTLARAQVDASRLTPPPTASAARWQAYHEQAAELYRRAADEDPDHHHEALAWAYVELEILAPKVQG